MPSPLHRRGLTLVEMLLAMAIATLLLLTAGLMLMAASRHLHRNAEILEGQRDLTAALQALEQSLRGASRLTVSAYTGTLAIAGSPPRRFVARQSSLFYEVDAGGAGTELIRGRLAAFDPQPGVRSIAVRLAVTAGGVTTEVNSVTTCRNFP